MTRIKVSLAYLFDGDSVLVTRRPLDKMYGGQWEFPGGKLEANETPEASIVRELQEELCIDVTVKKILQSYTYQVSEDTEIEFFPIYCEWELQPLTLTEHIDHRFLIPSEIKRLDLAPPDYKAVDLLMEFASKNDTRGLGS